MNNAACPVGWEVYSNPRCAERFRLSGVHSEDMRVLAGITQELECGGLNLRQGEGWHIAASALRELNAAKTALGRHVKEHHCVHPRLSTHQAPAPHSGLFLCSASGARLVNS